ncbi:pirin family protein [Shewanella amazonensis]|uniref:Pirin-like protein n=1 Tax=Shewanella amazonensis (strain ATCC BAA-1098 / SB2B) TaxID=326297 RepID=A1SBI7_SHEAM|nr:pirin family protein [Shewanella amazonensis]ABM01744.1 pirin-like protein [Shewanella amazonensis SB2B]
METEATQPVTERLLPRTSDVGGIPVARAIPQKARRLIGPWCFLDHLGPISGPATVNVGEHPHTALQTFTWMMAGEILHRDSLGSAQVIRPGQVNLMTAGHGIAHTEESLPNQTHLHAAQFWIALPAAHKDTAPRFDHYPTLPRWQDAGANFTLLVGDWGNHRSPVLHFSPILGLEIFHSADTGAPVTLTLPLEPTFEYGLMPLEGSFQLAGESFSDNQLAFVNRGETSVTIRLQAGCRLLLIGGEPLTDDITIWWNFVGHSKADIAEAQAQWLAQDPRFGPVTGYQGQRLEPPPIPW